MAQGYYTLDEAAKLLAMPVDELKMMARRGEIRSFQDRGTWRFRVQDIEEMARRRGIGSSDPDLPLGEAKPPKVSDSPAPLKGPASPPPKSPSPKSPQPKSPPPKRSPSKLGGSSRVTGGDVFDFTLEVDDESQASLSKPPSGAGGGKPPSSKKDQPKTPKPSSDSDVRLVGPEDDAFRLEIDSDVKMTDSPKPSPKPGKAPGSGKSVVGGPASPRPKSSQSQLSPGKSSRSQVGTGSSALRKSAVGPVQPQPADSGVRLVPLDSDSDVRIVPPDSGADVPLGQQRPRSATDSDIRLEADVPQGSSSDAEGVLTEEINLDEELRKQAAAEAQSKASPQLPSASPFELSELDLGLPLAAETTAPVSAEAGSSDFELTPAGESSSPIDLGSDEFNLELPDEGPAQSAGPLKTELKGPTSGINLDKPVDSGISLEERGGSDSVEFELQLDATGTPKPAPLEDSGTSSEFELTLDADDKPVTESSSDSEFELTLGVDDSSAEGPVAAGPSKDSSSDFELTLDADSSPADSADSSSDSEFELTLESSGESSSPVDSDSDSEFELTLEDSSASLELEVGGAPPPRKTQHEKDIFDADPDAAAAEEESGSEAVALDDGGDTDLESSDFDIALSEDDGAAQEESGSEVMALEEDDADDSGAAVARKGRKGRRAPSLDDEDVGFGGLDEEEAGEEEEGELVGAGGQLAVVAAPWGAVPVLFLVPCVVVMFVVGLMGFELVQSMSGYKQPGFLTQKVSSWILPK
jgi:excisionase family DNA binding protein